MLEFYLTPVASPEEKAAAELDDTTERAYRAERDKDYRLAIVEARKAVELEPDVVANRLLLVNVLMSAGHPAEAEAEATKAIKAGHAGAEIHAQRGYARSKLKNLNGAMSDWETALKQGLPSAQARNVRLSLADAALRPMNRCGRCARFRNWPSATTLRSARPMRCRRSGERKTRFPNS